MTSSDAMRIAGIDACAIYFRDYGAQRLSHRPRLCHWSHRAACASPAAYTFTPIWFTRIPQCFPSQWLQQRYDTFNVHTGSIYRLTTHVNTTGLRAASHGLQNFPDIWWVTFRLDDYFEVISFSDTYFRYYFIRDITRVKMLYFDGFRAPASLEYFMYFSIFSFI